MRLLIDMDGVLANFEAGFLREWRQRFPNRFIVPPANRDTFYIHDQYPAEYSDDISNIFNAKGFFRNLPVMEGCLKAIDELSKLDLEMFICTTPLSAYENCVLEKYQWVEEHLGWDWTRRIILTSDKTVVNADFLIDDKPVISGVANPMWEHVIYDWPQNRSETSKRRLTWANWKDVLYLKLAK